MNIEQCSVGKRVRINIPSNPVLNGETGVICGTDGESEISVKFDQYKEKFNDYDDTRRGWVTVEPQELDLILELTMNIDQRIQRIEAAAAATGAFPLSIAGTMITRVLKQGASGTARPLGPGYEWSIGIGGMGMPKQFYTGDSIEQIIETIEDELGIQS